MSEYSTEDLLSDKELPEVEEQEESSSEADEKSTGEESKSEEAESESEKATKEEESKDDDSPPESKASETTDEEPKDWTYKAVKDERRKRQELQAELDKLKQQQDPGKEREQQKPDWFNDPDAAAQQQQQQMQKMLFEQRAIMGQEIMRGQHDDFDEMETKFFQMLEENPHLGDGMRSAANPAKYAYETAKKAIEAEALKDVDGYKAKLEADVRKDVEAKVRAEYEAKLKKQQEKEGAILPTLSGASSKGGLKSDDWSGPTPLDEILK